MNTLDIHQFRSLVTMINGSSMKDSPAIIARLPVLKQKLQLFKTQNRKLYFQFLNRLLLEPDSFDNGTFEELKNSIELQDPDGISLYRFLKNDFLKNGLDKQITYDPTNYYFPKPALDKLAKCLSYDLQRQNYETLDQVVAFLDGNIDVEQYAALHILQTCIRYNKAILVADQLRDRLIHRAFVLTSPDLPLIVRLKSIEFFFVLAQTPAIDAIRHCLTSDEIQALFKHHFDLFALVYYVIRSIIHLKELFYDHVPEFIQKFTQKLNENKNEVLFGNQFYAEVIFELVDLENKRKSTVEEFEDFDIPHFTTCHNDFAGNLDVSTEILLEVYNCEKDNTHDGLLKSFLIKKNVDLGRLLDLPADLSNLPYEIQLHLYNGIKRDHTKNYSNLIKSMEHNLNHSTADPLLSKSTFDRFQVPPKTVESNIKRTIEGSWPTTSRAITLCPTSVALNPKARSDIELLLAVRRTEGRFINGQTQTRELRLVAEFIELIRIVVIKSQDVDAILQQFAPLFTARPEMAIVDTILHQYFYTLLQLCQGSISETVAKQYLQLYLLSPVASEHLVTISATELSLFVHAVTSLTPQEARALVTKICNGFNNPQDPYWNIEDSFELLRVIGQRGQFAATHVQNFLKDVPNTTHYNLFNVCSGFESTVGSQSYLDIVISMVDRHLRVKDDVQAEYLLKALHNLFDVHKKKSCAELFVAKMEVILSLIEPALADPSQETLMTFLYFIRDLLLTCPEQALTVLQHQSTVLRAIERALSSNELSFIMRDYVNQVSSALQPQTK